MAMLVGIPDAEDDRIQRDNVELNLHDLALYDFDEAAEGLDSMSAEDRDAHLKKVAEKNSARLIEAIFKLPSERSRDGRLAVLPEEEHKYALPRATPVPKPKAETRWEKFAKEKGIQKRKRDRMVYDEATGEYKPRWGYKSVANDRLKDWAIEVGSKTIPLKTHLRGESWKRSSV